MTNFNGILHFVGIAGHFLFSHFSQVTVTVFIGVIFSGEVTVSRFDLLVGGGGVYAQNLIGIFHGLFTFLLLYTLFLFITRCQHTFSGGRHPKVQYIPDDTAEITGLITSIITEIQCRFHGYQL